MEIDYYAKVNAFEVLRYNVINADQIVVSTKEDLLGCLGKRCKLP